MTWAPSPPGVISTLLPQTHFLLSFSIQKNTTSPQFRAKAGAFRSRNLFSLGCTLDYGVEGTGRASLFASGSQETFGNHPRLHPRPQLGEGSVIPPEVWSLQRWRLPRDCRESPGCGACSVRAHCVSGSPSLAGRPAPEPEGGARRRRKSPFGQGIAEPSWPGPPGGSTEPLNRSSLGASLGSPQRPSGSPLFRFQHCSPHLHLF